MYRANGDCDFHRARLCVSMECVGILNIVRILALKIVRNRGCMGNNRPLRNGKTVSLRRFLSHRFRNIHDILGPMSIRTVRVLSIVE